MEIPNPKSQIPKLMIAALCCIVAALPAAGPIIVNPWANYVASGGTPPALLLHFGGADESTDFVDSSTNNHADTVSGAAKIDNAQSKFGGTAGYFDGVGDYVTFSDHATLDLGTGDLTIEGFFYAESFSSSRCLVGKVTGAPTGNEWRLHCLASTGQLYFQYGAGILTHASLDPDLNTWHYFAIKRTGTTLSLWLDGTEGASTTTSFDFSNTEDLTIGEAGNQGEFKGWLDEFRITPAALDVSTVPTSEF